MTQNLAELIGYLPASSVKMTPDTTLAQIGLDSLDSISLAIELEEALGIDLDERGWAGWPLKTPLSTIVADIERARRRDA